MPTTSSCAEFAVCSPSPRLAAAWALSFGAASLRAGPTERARPGDADPESRHAPCCIFRCIFRAHFPCVRHGESAIIALAPCEDSKSGFAPQPCLDRGKAKAHLDNPTIQNNGRFLRLQCPPHVQNHGAFFPSSSFLSSWLSFSLFSHVIFSVAVIGTFFLAKPHRPLVRWTQREKASLLSRCEGESAHEPDELQGARRADPAPLWRSSKGRAPAGCDGRGSGASLQRRQAVRTGPPAWLAGALVWSCMSCALPGIVNPLNHAAQVSTQGLSHAFP